MMKQQQGAAMVEFAIVALLFFAVLFSVIEIGRWMFNWNTLVEATRRGARIAAVCPPGHPYIAIATVFGSTSNPNSTNVTSLVLNGLHTSDVSITYYRVRENPAGSGIGDYRDNPVCSSDPAIAIACGNAAVTDIAEIKFVEVSINFNNTTHPTPGPLRTFYAPVIGSILGQINPPTFRTLLPVESFNSILQKNPNLCYP